MRILAIRGCNIASLAGEFAIDLEAEPLASAHLYAIAGPTGAGKSSLLDTLCLALYDQTPRLGSAPGQGGRLPEASELQLSASDSRQLLRRGSSEGYAEVDFVGADGMRWRARWSVRRARGRRDGRLQAVEMSLLGLPQGLPAADCGSKTETLAAIQRRIGLDYRQFTHAVLLAQNEFAAFLRADQDERARLLQALTGSERLERLSIAAFERQRSERAALEALEAQLQATAPLAADPRAALEADCQAALQRRGECQQRRDRLRSWQGWQEELARRQAAVDGARQRHQQCQARSADAEAEAREIQLLRLLQPLRGHWLLTEEAHQAAVDLGDQLQRCSAEQQRLQDAARLAEQRLAAAIAQLESAEQHARSLQPQLQQARLLDQQLAQQRSQLDGLQARLQQASTSCLETETEISSNEEQQQRLQQQLAKLAVQLQQRTALTGLIEAGPRWQAQLRDWERLQLQRRSLAEQHELALQAQARAQQQLHSARDDLRQLADRVTVLRGQLAEAATRLTSLRAADPLARRALWQRSLQASQARGQAVRRISELRQQGHACQRRGEQARLTLDNATAALPDAERAVQRAEAASEQAAQALLTARSATGSAAEQRALLADGQPCPVCGSREHPWRDPDKLLQDLGATPSSDAARALQALLQSLNELHDRARSEAASRRQALAELQGSQTSARSSWLEATAEHAALQGAIEQAVHALDTDPVASAWLALEDADMLAELTAETERLAEEDAQLQRDEQALREAEAVHEQCRQAIDQLLAAQALADAGVQQARTLLHSTELDREALQVKLAAAAEQCERLGTELGNWLSPLQATLPESAVDELIEDLQQRLQAYLAVQTEQQTTLRQLNELASRRAPLQERLGTRRQARQEIAEQLTSQRQALQALTDQRAALLDGAAVDAVEHELEQARLQQAGAVQTCRRESEGATLQSAQASATTQALQTQLAQLSERARQLQDQRRQRWQALAPHWAEYCGQSLQRCLRLAEPGDADRDPTEEALRQRLSEAWAVEAETLTRREDQLQQLRTALLQAQTELQTRQQAVLEHEQSAPEGPRPTELTSELATSEADLAAAEAELLGLRLRLHDDDQLRAQLTQLSDRLGQQRASFDRWSRLSALIGSADGKKLRNLAQQRSLALLLHHGNAQLRELGSRYRLRPLADELNFLVVDNELDGELRLAHSLSGGESFLVSLALALALANLSSHELPIESLFIDEGFGSLDEDTLNVAMAALDRLQAEGRKVGVISHLRELTDRIAVKVEVVPTGLGRSRVVVSGNP